MAAKTIFWESFIIFLNCGRRAALTDLSKGSVFYVKVRAYKLNGKKKVYGSYSAVKKGKVKK